MESTPKLRGFNSFSVSIMCLSSSGLNLSILHIILSATVVEEKVIYWVDHMSEDVTIERTRYNIYDECFKTKSCFGLPDGCLETENCGSFGAVIVKDDVYTFEMQASGNHCTIVYFC